MEERTEPCGRKFRRGFIWLTDPLRLTLNFLSDNKRSNRVKVIFHFEILASLNNSPLFQTVSYAEDRSRKTVPDLFFIWYPFSMKVVSASSYSQHFWTLPIPLVALSVIVAEFTLITTFRTAFWHHILIFWLSVWQWLFLYAKVSEGTFITNHSGQFFYPVPASMP